VISYSVITGRCTKAVAVTVNRASTIALTSAAATQGQRYARYCNYDNGLHTFGGGATDATVTNLPTGLTSVVDTASTKQ
jgi:hypothetical protein